MLSSVPIPNNPSGIDNLFLLAHAALIYEFDAEKERSMTMTMRNPRLKIIPPKKPQCSCSALIPTSENNIFVPPKTKRTQEDEGKSQEPKAKRQRINPSVIRQVGPDPPPDLPTQFRDKINELQGSDLKLVIQKQLSETDMKSHFARLSLPNGQLRADFLSQPGAWIRLISSVGSWWSSIGLSHSSSSSSSPRVHADPDSPLKMLRC
uniref:Uncharacterized protein n=1 Tax=Fagus sylvatica TaxID=28930 RepID=A0A2N9FYE5_FAGSY